MLKTTLLSVIFIFAFSSLAAAQSVTSPAKESAERKAILAALRVPAEKEFKQKVMFVADHFRVVGNWAFVGGEPQTPEGGQPDYSGTPYQEEKEADMFDNNSFALLNKRGGKWRVVTYAIVCTDVCYLDWVGMYKAPKSVFPYTE